MRKKSTDNIEVIDEIRYRILDNIDDKYNKHQGTFVWDMISPTSFELGFIHQEIMNSSNLLSVENLNGELLDLRVFGITGIKRNPATFSTGIVTITGTDGTIVQQGTLVAAGEIIFETTKEMTIVNNEVKIPVICTQSGSVGNVMKGTINSFPVTTVGLNTVTNENDMENGYDEETDESLRERYYAQLRLPATSGNKYHYMLWAKSVTGVGDVYVDPLWNGNGTVKVVITDSNMNKPSEDLIKSVFDYIEEERPIGATVTVTGATLKDIKIDVRVRLFDGYAIGQVKEDFAAALEDYRKEIGFDAEYVSLGRIGNILLQYVEGVQDYEDLKLNGEFQNIPLEVEEIPTFNTINMEVIS